MTEPTWQQKRVATDIAAVVALVARIQRDKAAGWVLTDDIVDEARYRPQGDAENDLGRLGIDMFRYRLNKAADDGKLQKSRKAGGPSYWSIPPAP